MKYRISSLRHLCSATSFAGVAKSSSSVTMCERRIPIFLLTAKISCRWVHQRTILERGSQANFAIPGITGGDSP